MREKGKKKYTASSALERLGRNGYKIKTKTIYAPWPGPGIHLWGAIDYLVKVHQFSYGGLDL